MRQALKILHLAGYAAYLAGVFLVRPFPLTLVFLLGKFLGWLCFFVLPKRRRLAVDNMRSALGITRNEATTLARAHFMTLGANVLSMLKIAGMSDAAIGRHITLEIAPEIPQGTNPKGWVGVLSHMGNWEIVGRLTKLFPQFRFGAIYQQLANGHVNRHLTETRARMGVTLFDRQEGFWNSVAFLESGGVLGVLVDQYAGNSGTWMPFFGRLTSTSTLAAALAHRVGVDLVPVIVTTTGLARWHVTIGHPLDKGNSPEAATIRINVELERQISASPADWLWAHDRWKTARFGFLLSGANRRIVYPPRFRTQNLAPFRILVRSVDDPAEARLSVPAVQAIKRGRPDAQVTVVTAENLEEFWKSFAEVDGVIPFAPRENVFQVAEKIAAAGPFDVGILLPGTRRAAMEMTFAGVTARLGTPARPGLCYWGNSPGAKDPAPTGAERYRRIADAAGATVSSCFA